ncbi:hypothetical protein R1sor_011909 [Riccia sorocarpa]|uniref:Uncharacterized protein n=1 Tax=Riccia sorocarpa TaxID=122646 RepID=A0ABD3I2B9_9MARC
MRSESDPWYEQPAFVEHGMPEDIGRGRIDLNEDPIEMIPADDPETEDHGADDIVVGDVAAIAGLLAKVNVSGEDDESGGEAASRGRHSAERSIREDHWHDDVLVKDSQYRHEALLEHPKNVF